MTRPQDECPPAPLPAAVCPELVEEAPLGIFVVCDGRVVSGNRWMREFGGYAMREGDPPEMLALVHPDDRAAVSRGLLAPPAGADPLPVLTARFLRGDGAVREGELFMREFLLHGRPAVQGTLVDITSRAEAERALQESAVRLEESNRYRQLFGDILSHDLMNPVWVAENYLRLAMDGGVPEAKLPFYEGMRGSLAKARSILSDARTYLKLQDRVAFSREAADLGLLARETAQGLRPLWEEKGQTVSFTIAAEALCSGGPLLKDVVWHLLSNAVKYGPPGSPIEVVVIAGPRVRLEVRDRGPGVMEVDREMIFQRFERIEKGSIRGVGLGLAIVRRAMELYQGRSWVEDNPGGGSVFVVELPPADR